MKSLVLCALALVVVAAAHITEEEDVLVLNKSNFDEALKAHPNILVEFCECFRSCFFLSSVYFLKGARDESVPALRHFTTRKFIPAQQQ